jgi:hypothetical protein
VNAETPLFDVSISRNTRHHHHKKLVVDASIVVVVVVVVVVSIRNAPLMMEKK